MSELIPMFPLSIFPLPEELVPLHIFEPRYRQLLKDAETHDISFGIFFNHALNKEKWGSLVKLENVLRRFPSGESDIIVRCTDIFTLTRLDRNYKKKLYPGGEVRFWDADLSEPVSAILKMQYQQYLTHRKLHESVKPPSVFEIANQLNLDFEEKIKFLNGNPEYRESFLQAQIKYHLQLLEQAEKAKDVFHLN